ncbi:DUF3800 domain-containing protein [Vibrio fluvialis]|nr:DUF3800 domain-containing protein [Vibrio fluvialis]
MHIFIDESGLFKPTENMNQWSSVGAFVAPDHALEKLPQVLNELKRLHGLSPDDEFKRPRPDETSDGFIEFFKELKRLGCTFHANTHTGNQGEEIAFDNYQIMLLSGIERYAERRDMEQSYLDEVKTLINKLSKQQLAQCVHQSYMIDGLLRKILSYYSIYSPESLGQFKWQVDAKELNETNYDKVFDTLYSGIVGLSHPIGLVFGERNDYSYLFKAYGANSNNIDEYLEETKNSLEKDFTQYRDSLLTFNKEDLLRNSFELVDSKDSVGLQISDLITSSLNRCLKLNFDNNYAMAEMIGSLVINSPTLHPSINFMSFGSDHIQVNEESWNVLQHLSDSSIEFFGSELRNNLTKNMQNI